MCDEIYLKSTSCEDIETTISLPIQLPECKKSKTFELYEHSKDLAQAELIEKMIISVDKIDLSMNMELEQISAFAIEELKFITEEVGFDEHNEMISIEHVKALLRQNEKISTKLINLVDEYDNDLKSLELRRANLLQETVSNQFYEINKSICPTEDGQRKVDDIIIQLNRNMLKNMQRNEDLKLKIQVEGQEMLKIYKQTLKDKIWMAADKHALHLWNLLKMKQENRMVLEATISLNLENSKIRDEFTQATNNLVSNLTKFTEVLELPAGCEVSEELWKQWIEDFHQKLEMLSTISKNVENLLKTAVTTLFESFDEKVNLLSRTITPIAGSGQPNECKQSNDVTDEINELKANQREELKNLQETWHNIFIVLNNKTERTKGFFQDLTLLWTNHMSRMHTFQKDLEEALETKIKQCEKEDKVKVTKLKYQIKCLREAKDLHKLEQQYSTVVSSIDDIYKLWGENMQSSLELIDGIEEKYIGRFIEENKSEVLNFLLVKYPKGDILSDEFSPKLKTFDSEFDKQVGICNSYLTAVDHRTIGMYEMLEHYMPLNEDVIRKEINYCLEMKKIDIFNEFENHVTLIQELRTKTLEETKQMRSAELNVHSERIISHSRAVKLILENINKQYNELKLNQQRKLADFNEKVKATTDNITLYTSQHLKDIISDLEINWASLSQSSLADIASAKTFIEDKFKTIKNSNDMFKKMPKVFKKGGNYSPEEVKTLNRELKLLEKLFKSQQKLIINNYDGLQKVLSENILDDKISFLKDYLVKQKKEENIIDVLTIARQHLAFEMKTVQSSERLLDLNIRKLANLQELDQNVLISIYDKAALLSDNLMFPVGVLNLECSKYESTNASNSPSKSKSQKKSSCEVKTLFINANDSIKNENNTFLSRTKGLLLDKYSRLVKLIEDTYEVKETQSEKKQKSTTLKKKKESKKETDHDEVTVRVKSIKTTLLSYNLECESFWLQEVPKILHDINSFQTITVLLLEKKLSSVHSDYMNSLKQLENCYNKKVQEYVLQGINERNNIKKSLVLPLAHPTHHEKLKELHNKALNLVQSQKTKFKKDFDVYRDTLQNYHNNYVEQLKELKETINDVQSRVDCKEIFDNLIQNYKSVIVSMPIKSNFPSEDSDIEGKNAVEKLSNPENKDVGPKYPQSIWSDNENLEEKFTDITDELSYNNKISEIKLSERFLTSNIKKTATSQLKQSADQIQTLVDKAKLNLCENEVVINEWVKSFEYNMGQAKSMFSSICN